MKNSKPFWIVMLVFFIIYMSIFMASRTGYYEYENKNRKELTEAKMKEFEEDVKLGKNIDIKNYFKDNSLNYENKLTFLGNKISSLINSGVNKSLKGSFKLLEKILN